MAAKVEDGEAVADAEEDVVDLVGGDVAAVVVADLAQVFAESEHDVE